MREFVGAQTMGCENLTANVNNATNIAQHSVFLLRATMCARMVANCDECNHSYGGLSFKYRVTQFNM